MEKNFIKDVVGVEQKMRVDVRGVLFSEFRSYGIEIPFAHSEIHGPKNGHRCLTEPPR